MITLANPRRLAESRATAGGRERSAPSPGRAARRIAAGDSEPLTTHDGTPLVLRAIRADDVAALQRFFSRLTPEEVRMRFLHTVNELPDAFVLQLCALDPGVAAAWVLATPDDPARSDTSIEIHGVARAHLDRACHQAEYAIVIEGRFARQGFGTLLMRRAIDSARRLGATELWGEVFGDNHAMLALCAKLGFQRSTSNSNPGLVRVDLALTAPVTFSSSAPTDQGAANDAYFRSDATRR